LQGLARSLSCMVPWASSCTEQDVPHGVPNKILSDISSVHRRELVLQLFFGYGCPWLLLETADALVHNDSTPSRNSGPHTSCTCCGLCVCLFTERCVSHESLNTEGTSQPRKTKLGCCTTVSFMNLRAAACSAAAVAVQQQHVVADQATSH
jgi:hypothetical protein